MSRSAIVDDDLLWRLQRALPLIARGRSPLLAFLRSRATIGNVSPKLKIVGIFRAGEQEEFMCRFTIDDSGCSKIFCAPLDQLAVDRRYPVARELLQRSR